MLRMRAVIQRVSRAAVEVDSETVASIDGGILLLVGVEPGDTVEDVHSLADKVANMRIFTDLEDRMNLSIIDTKGSLLLVSQFTLLADISRGRRPSFTAAAQPEMASELIEQLGKAFGKMGIPTHQGRFGAKMRVSLENDGPVTILVEVRGGRVS